MEPHRRELYREFTGWSAWIHLLLWGVIIGSALAVLFGTGEGEAWSDPGRLSGAAGTIFLMGLIYWLFGGLLVIVYATEIRVGLGKGWIFKTWIPLQEIVSLECVTYRPLREFGGWGLRGSRTKRAWTARGNQAVVLSMRDGRRIYIGSDDPSRLEGRIRMAMAAAPGARGEG